MGLLLENFKMAISSIRSNKMRSLLTMLGIIIGIASVITITAVGETTKSTMNKYISAFGKNRIMISLQLNSDNVPDETKFFSNEDVVYLRDKFKDEIVYAAPGNNYANKIKKGTKEVEINIAAADYNYIKDLSTNTIIYGRDMQVSDVEGRKNIILVNKEFAKKLYSRENVVGEEITANIDENTVTLTIVGVFNKEKSIFDSLEGSATEAYVPYTITNRSSYYMDIKLSDELNPKTVSEKIRSFTVRYKRTSDDTYSARTMEEQTQMINNMLNMLSLGLGAIAGISLVVGGIGIMNIMLVSVTERTKEIGIRKSLGARKKDILFQFLIESVLLSGAGGIIGTAIGLGLSGTAAALMNVEPAISISSVVIAVVFSFAVGMFFGIFPANKAAKLDPIDALRYE